MGRRSSKRFRTSTVAIKESEDQPEEEVDEEVVENDKSEEIQPEEEGQEEGEYEIECIVAARVIAQPKGKKSATNWEYYVRWAGYGPEADEWVQTSGIDADVLIKRFWKHIKWDNRDYFPGDTMNASEQWIEEQHDLFIANKKREKEEEDARKRRKLQSQSPRKRNEVDDNPTPGRSKRQHDKGKKAETRTSPQRSKKRKTRATASSDVEMPSNEESTSTPEPVGAPDSIADEQEETFDEPQDQDQDSLFDGSSSDYEDNRMETPQPPPPLTPPPSDPPILRDTRLTAEKQTRSLFVSVSGADSESANEQESASTSKHTTNRPRKPISRPKIVPMFMSSRANPVAGPSKPIKKTRPGRPPFLVPRPPTPSKHNDAREKSSADVEMQDIDQIEQFPPDEAPSSDMLVPSKAQAQDVTMYSSSSSTEEVNTFLFPTETSASIVPESAPTSDTWSWQGACHIFSDANKRSSCTVIMCEVQTQPPIEGKTPPQALLKHVFGTSAKHQGLNLEKLVPASQLPIHLAATSRRWTQLVRIEPKDTKDRKLIEATKVYLGRKLSVSFVPLNKRRSDGTDNSLGIMIVFPRSNSQLCQSLDIPSALLGGGELLGAVYPWALSAYRYSTLSEGISTVSLKPDGPPYPLLSRPAQIKRTELRAEQAVLYRAVVLLRFPYELMDRIKKKGGVTYAVWSLHDAHVHEVPDMETRALNIIMTRFKSRFVKFDTHPHMVFIHVGALATLYRSSALMQLRASRPDVSFKLYGTHISIHPSSWGIRDIWPLGGIITFTPGVLAKHSVEVAVLIASLRADPTWTSFILPSVLGAVMKRRNLAVDPLKLHSLGIDVQPAEIITAINQGHVALMRLPRRLDFTTDITISENVLWQYEELVEPVEGSFVKSALEKFEKLAHDRTPEAIEVELRKELNSHMKDFQTQAPMITNYRRYVVIGVEEEAPAYAATYTWCEFATLSSFNRSS